MLIVSICLLCSVYGAHGSVTNLQLEIDKRNVGFGSGMGMLHPPPGSGFARPKVDGSRGLPSDPRVALRGEQLQKSRRVATTRHSSNSSRCRTQS